jgi:hypothetical protein
MKDLERLNVSGDRDEQRLLQSARDVRVPDPVKDDVRRAVEQRTQARGSAWRGWRLGVAAAGVLLAATAAAQGREGLRRIWTALVGAPAVEAPAPRPRAALPQHVWPAQMEPPRPATLQAPPVPAPARRTLEPARRTAQAEPQPAPEAKPLRRPGLDMPTLLRAGDDKPPPQPPPAAAERLVIARSGRRDIVLGVSGNGIRGEVRGASLALAAKGSWITGQIAGDELMIHFFGSRQAEGSVGGRPLGFQFNPTERGWIVGASLPEHGGRVELDGGRLSFLPGCDRDLAAVSGRAGVYEGTCADGAHVRIELPPSFMRMPELVRMVTLGMLLPEPDPALRSTERGLFPDP